MIECKLIRRRYPIISKRVCANPMGDPICKWGFKPHPKLSRGLALNIVSFGFLKLSHMKVMLLLKFLKCHFSIKSDVLAPLTVLPRKGRKRKWIVH